MHQGLEFTWSLICIGRGRSCQGFLHRQGVRQVCINARLVWIDLPALARSRMSFIRPFSETNLHHPLPRPIFFILNLPRYSINNHDTPLNSSLPKPPPLTQDTNLPPSSPNTSHLSRPPPIQTPSAPPPPQSTPSPPRPESHPPPSSTSPPHHHHHHRSTYSCPTHPALPARSTSSD